METAVANSFFIKLQAFKPELCWSKEELHKGSFVNFTNFFRTAFQQNSSRWLLPKIFETHEHFKQANNVYILFYDIQVPGLHTIQYWNIYKVVVIRVKKKKRKNYLHRGSCAPCGRWLVRKILSRVKTTFKHSHNLNCEIS